MPNSFAKLAPHVDVHWVDDFILEARLRDLPGAVIGDALAEVDAHVAESGEDAAATFGDAKKYAVSLAAAERPSPQSAAVAVLPAVIQTLGMFITLWAVQGQADGGPAVITIGSLLTLAALGLCFATLAWQANAILRLIVDRPIVAFLMFVAVLGATTALGFIPGTIAALSPFVGLALGVVLVLAGTVLGLGRARSDDDPIAQPGVETRRSIVAPLTHLMIPIVTAVLAAFTFMF